jgi:Na+-driven multidrug efflux pump
MLWFISSSEKCLSTLAFYLNSRLIRAWLSFILNFSTGRLTHFVFSSGIARGCGWQHLGAYVNLGSFYLVGIPTALLLGFVLKMEGKGLWMGISCGSIVQFLLLAVITFFSNWQKMVCSSYEPLQFFSGSYHTNKSFVAFY